MLAPIAAPVARIAAHPASKGTAALSARAATTVADFLVPPVCISCRTQLTSHHTLCPHCWIGVDFIRAPVCDCLGTPLPFDTGGITVSAAALAAPPAYDRARAVALHTDIMRGLIHSLKYGDRTDGLAVFGRWLAAAAADLLPETDVIIPIPLNRWRLWQRRFNQAASLSQALARETGLPTDTLALSRIRQTRSQVGLTINQRRTNVSGAFRVPDAKKEHLAGKSVLLVDDVMTTGATIDAATRALRRAGVQTVNVVALARVIEPVQPTA